MGYCKELIHELAYRSCFAGNMVLNLQEPIFIYDLSAEFANVNF